MPQRFMTACRYLKFKATDPLNLAGLLAGVFAAAIAGAMQQQDSLEHYERFVDKTIIKPGDDVNITSRAQRPSDGCDAIVTYKWVDGVGNVLATIVLQSDGRPAGDAVYTRTLEVPDTLTTHVVVLRTSIEFRCNFIQEILGGQLLVMPDIYFNVVTTSMEVPNGLDQGRLGEVPSPGSAESLERAWSVYRPARRPVWAQDSGSSTDVSEAPQAQCRRNCRPEDVLGTAESFFDDGAP